MDFLSKWALRYIPCCGRVSCLFVCNVYLIDVSRKITSAFIIMEMYYVQQQHVFSPKKPFLIVFWVTEMTGFSISTVVSCCNTTWWMSMYLTNMSISKLSTELKQSFIPTCKCCQKSMLQETRFLHFIHIFFNCYTRPCFFFFACLKLVVYTVNIIHILGNIKVVYTCIF